MPVRTRLVNSEFDATAPRPSGLIDAALLQIAQTGMDGASARNIAARIDAPASAINYHFGSIEQLFCVALHHAAEQMETWLHTRLEAVRHAAPWPATAFPAFAASVTDDACRSLRTLCQAEASDFMQLNWRSSETPRRWLQLWRNFWKEALTLFSIDPAYAYAVAAIMQSERFGHLAQWRPPHDRAALEEICVRLTARLSDDRDLLMRPAPWRLAAEAQSCAQVSFPQLSGTAARVAEAVVIAVDEGGESGLTHRTTAARAGLSLGAVTHHFPNRTALMTAGYTFLYQGVVETALKTNPRIATHGDLGRHMVDFMAVGGAAPRARALESFFLASTRDPSMTEFAARIRYSRGRTSFGFLGPIFSQLDRQDGVLISHWIAGAARGANAIPEQKTDITAEILTLAPVVFSMRPAGVNELRK